MSRFFVTLFSLTFLSVAAAHAQFLHERTFSIEAVTVTAEGEDRAYRIMRRAIAHAPWHAARVTEYDAGVYLKGALDVVKISRAVRGVADNTIKNIREGESYTQESWNEVSFVAPDKYDQRVVKQLSSMPRLGSVGGGNVEEGAMRLLNLNIYDTGATDGLIISPLSPGAFTHYRFRYEGYVEQGGRIVDKIRVMPVRYSQQLVEGHIYIAEDDWSVRGFDLSGHISLIAGIEFRLQTTYGEQIPGVWMPTLHRITFDLGLLGSRGTVRYVASVDYGRIALNPALEPAPSETAPVLEDEAPEIAIAPPLPPEDERFTNRDSYRTARRTRRKIEAPARRNLDVTGEFADNFTITVDSLAREPDPGFWDRVRPIALEPAEIEGYRLREVAATAAPDTVPPRRRRKTIAAKFIFGDKSWKLGKRGGEILWHGVIPSKSGFNTVDGFYFGIAPIDYRKSFVVGRGPTLILSPQGGWAIDRRALLADMMARLEFAPRRRGEFELRAGSVSRNFASNPGDGILPFDNTVASLVFRRNYLKLYGDNFVEAAGSIDVVNGLALSVSAKYSLRRGLENSSDYSFFYRKEREYTENKMIEDHTAAILTVGMEYTPHQYYRIGDDGRKRMVRSDWPTFFVGWKKGVRGVWGSTADFDHISGGIRQNIDLGGPFHRLEYFVYGGAFATGLSLHFPDYRHFDTADLPVTNSSITNVGSYRMLGSYVHSTPDRYLELHVSYQARFLLIKLLPWFSGRLWTEGMQLHYLDTPGLRHHMEIDYTVGMLWKAGLFVGFDNFRYTRLGFKFSIPIKISRRGA
ncbi:MAG: DUF5686 family protein [Alistipes sp.]|jgi:hypothetical protein|nr:DUF5686 family protein [Alistipes sp.]